MEMTVCNRCMGYGWWPIGQLNPIGPIDSHEWGKLIIMCPWCKHGTVNEGDRYNALVEVFNEEMKIRRYESPDGSRGVSKPDKKTRRKVAN